MTIQPDVPSDYSFLEGVDAMNDLKSWLTEVFEDGFLGDVATSADIARMAYLVAEAVTGGSELATLATVLALVQRGQLKAHDHASRVLVISGVVMERTLKDVMNALDRADEMNRSEEE